jgi:hypothetical protein
MKTVGEIKGRLGSWKKHWFAVFRGAAPGSEVGQGLFGSEGAAAIELALILPVLVFMLVAVIELGRLAYFSIEVSNAAHAGAQYGAQSIITAANTAGMQLAAQQDGYDVPGLQVTVNLPFCECSTTPSGSTGPPGLSCVLTSCSGSELIEYVWVQTRATVNPLLKYPGIPASYTLNGSAIMRVAEPG